MKLKLASATDVERIYEIWRDRNSPALPFVQSEFEFFKTRVEQEYASFPVWVCEVAGEVLGWASLSPMRTNPAVWETMAELSFYVARDNVGQGIGGALAKVLIDFATNDSSIEWVHAWVSNRNEASIRALESIGSRNMSTFDPVNRKPTRDTIVLYSIPVTGFPAESNSGQE